MLSIECSYILMQKTSGMQVEIAWVRALDKAREIVQPLGPWVLSAPLLDSLIHLLERVDASPASQAQHFPQAKGELKFYARTAFLALAVRCGDCTDSSEIVAGIADSSFYLAHKYCLDFSNFTEFLSSAEITQKEEYFLSEQHLQLELCLSQLLGAESKVSTPFDFARVVASHFNTSSNLSLLECLIEFALTVPETCELSSEEIFVGCCLLVVEKANSGPMLVLVQTSFGSAMHKGGQLMALMKDLFASINGEP